MIQGFGRRLGRRDRFDALFGYGPIVLARRGAGGSIGVEERQSLDRAGIKLVEIDADDGRDALEDEDGAYEQWFAEHDCHVAAVRPDFHVWGTASADRSSIGKLVASFATFAATARKAPLRGLGNAAPRTEAETRCEASANRV